MFAPLPLQDGYDNAGLQIGLTEAEVTGVLLCLDVTEQVIDEAEALGCNLVISHHPLLFKPLKRITGGNSVERCVIKAISKGIAIYSAHTNLDNAQGGVNHRIACKIGLENVQTLVPKEDSLLKLAVYVPVSKADEVREALFAAGCGNIGNYDCCSYNIEGTGTFRAGGDVVWGTALDLIPQWLICIPVTAFVALKLQLGAWPIAMAIQLECLVKVPPCILRMNSGRWIHDVTISHKQEARS